MKQTKLFFSITAIILSICSTCLADVKIKTRTTVAEQTSESTVYIKGRRQRSEQDFGGMKTVTLTQCDLRRDARLNIQAKTYFLSLYNGGGLAAETVQNQQTKIQNQKGGVITTTVTLKDTGERKQMFGYTARRILSTTVMESSPEACSPIKTRMETDGWYIDAEFAFDCLLNRQYQTPSENSGCADRQELKRVGSAKLGYPVYLKTTMRGEKGSEDFTTVTEVLEISPATLDAALFEIPADYREVKNQADLFKGGFVETSDDDGDDEDVEEKDRKSALSRTDKKSARSNAVSNVDSNQKVVPNPSATKLAVKSGVVRLGIVPVKTGSVGEGMSAAELSAAVKNSLAEYLKGANVELVEIEARLPQPIKAEAEQKSVDYVIYASVSHKKGGGGFGKFLSKAVPILTDAIPGSTGTVAGNAAIYAGKEAIYSAADAAENVRAKDELTLDIRLEAADADVLKKQLKARAKSDGEDIISPLAEQAAEAVIQSISQK